MSVSGESIAVAESSATREGMAQPGRAPTPVGEITSLGGSNPPPFVTSFSGVARASPSVTPREFDHRRRATRVDGSGAESRSAAAPNRFDDDGTGLVDHDLLVLELEREGELAFVRWATRGEEGIEGVEVDVVVEAFELDRVAVLRERDGLDDGGGGGRRRPVVSDTEHVTVPAVVRWR